MKTTAPKIDKRSFQELLRQMQSMAPFYTPEWDPTIDKDPGQALMKIYLHMLEQVITRLNQVPDKNFIKFLDWLGIKMLPAQSASATITFKLAEGTKEPVTVPKGTLVVGEGTDGNEVIFETEADLRVTPSVLKEIYSFDAEQDEIFAHTDAFNQGEKFRLLTGQNKQERSLYLGHADLFSQTHPSKITIDFDIQTGATGGILQIIWEYWGGERWVELERFTTIPAATGQVDTTELLRKTGKMVVGKEHIGEIALFELFGSKSRWLRCRLKNKLPATDPVQLPIINTIDLSVEPLDPFPAELAFNNDIPISLEEKTLELMGGDLKFISLAGNQLTITDGGFLVTDLMVGDELELNNQTDPPEVRKIIVIDSINSGIITLDRTLDHGYIVNTNNPVLSPIVKLHTVIKGRDEVQFSLVSGFIYKAKKDIQLNIIKGKIEVGDWIQFQSSDKTKPYEERKILKIDQNNYTLDNKLVNDYSNGDTVKLVAYSSLARIIPADIFDKTNKSVALGHGDNIEIANLEDIEIFKKGDKEFIKKLYIYRNGSKGNPYSTSDRIKILPIIKPFGNLPILFDTFYIASDEAFSKKEAIITLNINSKWATLPINDPDSTQDPTPTAVLSWEYWNGKSWQILNVVDKTNKFKDSGNITFTCPSDIEKIKVNGEEKYWIRVRIIDGDFGKEIILVSKEIGVDPFKISTVEIVKGKIHYPVITSLVISYQGVQEKPQQCFSLNNLDYEDHIKAVLDTQKRFTPFKKFSERSQGLLLGFDKPVIGGPFGILFNLTEQVVSETDTLKMEWFYWQGNQWIKINAQDNTENLTRIGLFNFTIPIDFLPGKLFDKEQYWIKGIVSNSQFNSQDSDQEGLEAPEIIGIFPNSTNAVQASVVEDEVLGTSDLTANQAFQLLNPLIISQEILVTEPFPPSEDERRDLIQEEGKDAIEEIQDDQGEIQGYRVRWHEVDDFYDSKPKSRHYVVDKRQGIILFGDGIHGLVPPAGADNIRVNYRFGGGKNGNVAAGKINGLKNSIPFVNEVTNHLPADGGSETETIEGVMDRGPQQLKNRGRAVTREDFEVLAKNASRKIARAKCLPHTDESGSFALGHVCVLIVPDTQTANEPVSRTLRDVVSRYLNEQSSNLLSTAQDIHVRDADYIEIIIEATVVPVSLEATARVDEAVSKALKRYIHPLTGGRQGKGWEFGENVCRSEIFALLESISDVDYVKDLVIFADGERKEDDFSIEKTVLPYSGEHNVNIQFDPAASAKNKNGVNSECKTQNIEFCSGEEI